MRSKFEALRHSVEECNQCPRLREHCEEVAKIKRRAYLKDTYWGKPIYGFGDPQAQLLILGLAPAAHGANRTGRVFTGDRSGEWLYRALHKAHFSNQPTSLHSQDTLQLQNAYITCLVKCAPPDNKPSPQEQAACLQHLKKELELLSQVQVYIALGQIAFNGIWPLIGEGIKKPAFGHGVEIELKNHQWLILSYHPSQQNTFTGKLTEPMFDRIFESARKKIQSKKL